MKVLFVVPYPLGKAASQRVRVEQFFPSLQEQQVTCSIAPFWSKSAWRILYRQGHTLEKAVGLCAGFLRRAFLLLQLPRYDYVFIHREATPVGPPWFEWLAAKVLRKKLIYDFDDAIWLNNTSPENKPATKYKQHSKVPYICRWSYKISLGNRFLLDYAKQFNPQAEYLPSTVDLAGKYNKLKKHTASPVVIGWIGSHSTLPYLMQLEPVLQQLEQKYSFRLKVVADKKPALHLQPLEFVTWRAETEVQELLTFDIGLMPLPDTAWAKGKCAYKAIQYMALGVPAVVSAVGANVVAVPNGVAGYTCANMQDWYNNLEKLLNDAVLRQQLGAAGKVWVKEKYALAAHQHTFLRLFT